MSIRIEGVRLALGDLWLEASHEFTRPRSALFGPSGAGKTAFLELVAGLRRPSTGRIELDGATVVDVGRKVDLPARARGVGYVPQDVALFPHLPVRENLNYGATSERTALSPGWASERIPITFEHVVEVLEIGPLVDRMPGTLSGGEKQRVAVGRALLSHPRVLLLDEPLASLDASLKGRTLDLLRRVHEEFGVPMLYVTHAPEEVVQLCEEVVLFEAGHMVGHGPPGAIFERKVVHELRVRLAARGA